MPRPLSMSPQLVLLHFRVSEFLNTVVLQENLCILKCDIYLSPCQIAEDLRMQFRGGSCVGGETHKFGHRAMKPWNILKSASASHKLVKHNLLQCTYWALFCASRRIAIEFAQLVDNKLASLEAVLVWNNNDAASNNLTCHIFRKGPSRDSL